MTSNPYDTVTFAFLQDYVAEAEVRKGHSEDDIKTKVLILMEELGELAKALRIFLGMKIHSKTAKHVLADEFGDVLYLVISLANRTNVNLSEALMVKVSKDESKVYKPATEDDANGTTDY